MKTLRLAWLTITQLLWQACRVLQAIMKAGRQRQRQLVMKKYEAERLDRILNPSKYRGK